MVIAIGLFDGWLLPLCSFIINVAFVVVIDDRRQFCCVYAFKLRSVQIAREILAAPRGACCGRDSRGEARAARG